MILMLSLDAYRMEAPLTKLVESGSKTDGSDRDRLTSLKGSLEVTVTDLVVLTPKIHIFRF